MMFGSLVPYKGRLALEVLGLDGKVVDYQEMLYVTAYGSGGGPVEAKSAYVPTYDYGSSYYHYDISEFDMSGWSSGAYSGASWVGHSFAIDVSKFWTPTSSSITTQVSVTDFWGSSFTSPWYESSSGHSQSMQTLEIRSESFDWNGFSAFRLDSRSDQSFDFSHVRFGEITIDSSHAESAARTEIHQISLGANGVSAFDQIMVSLDVSDSFRFATPTSVTQQNSSVHDDLNIMNWLNNGSYGSSAETLHSEHQSLSDFGVGYSDFSSHDVAIHEVVQNSHYLM